MRRWISLAVSVLSMVGILPSSTLNGDRPAVRREGRAEHYHVPDEIFPEPPASVAFAQVSTTTSGWVNYAFGPAPSARFCGGCIPDTEMPSVIKVDGGGGSLAD